MGLEVAAGTFGPVFTHPIILLLPRSLSGNLGHHTRGTDHVARSGCVQFDYASVAVAPRGG
eukprot:10017729-Heterocapsa_arctica.AAC.1